MLCKATSLLDFPRRPVFQTGFFGAKGSDNYRDRVGGLSILFVFNLIHFSQYLIVNLQLLLY